jgi:hypothetical protein
MMAVDKVPDANANQQIMRGQHLSDNLPNDRQMLSSPPISIEVDKVPNADHNQQCMLNRLT